MHESFDVTNACLWPNAYFAELIDGLISRGQLTAELLALPHKQCGNITVHPDH